MKTAVPTTTTTSPFTQMVRFDIGGLERLVERLRSEGYEVLGPVVRDGAIVIEPIESVEQLPDGIGDDQDGGHYRLRQRDDHSRFGYAVGPSSWKRFLFPPRRLLWRAIRHERGFSVETPLPETQPRAFIGVRGCELAAITIQDRVFSGGEFPDPDYVSRRAHTLVVAVECGAPAQTCFCASVGTGPAIDEGFDIRLTEVIDAKNPTYLAIAGSDRGAKLLAQVESSPVGEAELAERAAMLAGAEARMTRNLNPDVARAAVLENAEHPRWEAIASRCLTCGNCTQVCPTCFCSTVEDVTDLTTGVAERSRRWDSCFTMEHSHVHGGAVRRSSRSRYRQWLTHKLGTWNEQFGTAGCTGCGRCISWCPVGIDLTEEVAYLASKHKAPLEDAS